MKNNLETQKKNLRAATAYLASLGCPKNLVDSEIIAGTLIRKGVGITSDPAGADIFIVNTCAFIKPARDEAEGWIRKAARWKSTRPGRKIIVCGCLNQHGSSSEFRRKYPDVDIWAGIDDIEKIPEIIASGCREGAATANRPSYLYSDRTDRLQSTPAHYAYLKISDGCDNRCSYCAIPGIRGSLRSRKMDSIIREAENLVRNGCREIILISQDSTAYGFDFDGSYGHLPELISGLDGISGDFSVRLMYAHPAHFTEKLVMAYAQSRRLLQYVDLPVQHISDRILKEMGRKTGSSRIRELICRLRSEVKDICIRTSLIVGFPGEEESDFEELLSFVKEIRFDRLGVFSYSREDGTPAARLEKQVPGEVADSRRDRIMKAQAQISLELNRKLVGTAQDVIVDSIRKGLAEGRTYRDAPDIDGRATVKLIRGMKASPGDRIRAEIKSVSTYGIRGEALP